MIEDLKKNVSDITSRAEVKKYLTKVLKGEANDGSGLIYGLGHAVYTLSDPRAKLLKEMAKELASAKNMLDDFMLCDYIEEIGPALYLSTVPNKSSPFKAFSLAPSTFSNIHTNFVAEK